MLFIKYQLTCEKILINSIKGCVLTSSPLRDVLGNFSGSFGVLHLRLYVKSAFHRWVIYLICSTLSMCSKQYDQNYKFTSSEHDVTKFIEAPPSTRHTIQNANLCLLSQVLKHRLRIWSFPHSFHTLHQPEQKPLSQKTVISSGHCSEEGRKWWYRIKNSCSAVTPCNSVSQLDAIP